MRLLCRSSLHLLHSVQPHYSSCFVLFLFSLKKKAGTIHWRGNNALLAQAPLLQFPVIPVPHSHAPPHHLRTNQFIDWLIYLLSSICKTPVESLGLPDLQDRPPLSSQTEAFTENCNACSLEAVSMAGRDELKMSHEEKGGWPSQDKRRGRRKRTRTEAEGMKSNTRSSELKAEVVRGKPRKGATVMPGQDESWATLLRRSL